MGMIPDPPPTGSPDRIASSVLRDWLWGSKPEMIEDVGDVRPRLLGNEFALYDDVGYRELYVPVVDMADEGKLFEASCWTLTRSVSSVALRFCDLSSSAVVLDKFSCSDDSCCCRS